MCTARTQPLPERALMRTVRLATSRTFEQDPKYAIRLLVDIAIRALSPAINDPTTAVQALDQIEDLLRRLGRRELDAGHAFDANGTLRVIFPMPTWEDYLALSFDEIRQFGATSVQVVRRLRSALVGLGDTIAVEDRRDAVLRYLEHLNRGVGRSTFDDQDQAAALAGGSAGTWPFAQTAGTEASVGCCADAPAGAGRTMRTVEITYRYGDTDALARPRPPDADAARLRLNEGNRVFAGLLDGLAADSGTAHRIIDVDPGDLGLLAGEQGAPKQRPFAAVLGCSDARVPIELIFNEGPNDLFVVRVAGNGLGNDVLGSLRYAIDHLRGSLRLVVVLGHSGCGAMSAAVDSFLEPAGYLPLATDHALRSILDRQLIVVQATARKLTSVFGSDVTQNRAVPRGADRGIHRHQRSACGLYRATGTARP